MAGSNDWFEQALTALENCRGLLEQMFQHNAADMLDDIHAMLGEVGELAQQTLTPDLAACREAIANADLRVAAVAHKIDGLIRSIREVRG